MIRRPPRSTLSSSSAASDVYKRQGACGAAGHVKPRANHPDSDLRPCVITMALSKGAIGAGRSALTTCGGQSPHFSRAPSSQSGPTSAGQRRQSPPTASSGLVANGTRMVGRFEPCS
eukprot:TRINITY_DN14071_c0_g1_i1.p1 TRINITY_DN14071_c0_g1~~TRINITY_DN14071_c0_g1_i1.p1  ORF type:complete len:117 (+),score=14.94 TRINITY_DN14071_c0_g1_i1:138-488(+)